MPAERRTGTITLWTIIFLPVLIVLLYVVVEGIHLWLARVELENSLEAAALAAVAEWADGGDTVAPGWTYDAREMGVDFAWANTVAGDNLVIAENGGNYNLGTNPNENIQCGVDVTPPGGNLIFGSVSLDEPYIFRAGVAPQCEHFEFFGTIGLNIEINTGPQGSTYGDYDAFFVELLNVPSPPPPGTYITSIIYNVATLGGNGRFHVDSSLGPPPPPPPSEGTASPMPVNGWGPYYNAGASVEVGGGTPFSPVFTPDGSSTILSPTLQIDFDSGEFEGG